MQKKEGQVNLTSDKYVYLQEMDIYITAPKTLHSLYSNLLYEVRQVTMSAIKVEKVSCLSLGSGN